MAALTGFIMDILRCYLRFGRWAKRTLFNPLKYAVVILLATVIVLSITSVLPIPGNFESMVVMSGSMSPAIRVGSVAFVRATDEVKVGDIVTFKNPNDPSTNFTHRVISIEEGKIKTKGDANNAPDSWELTQADVVGKFLFSIPLLGYAVHFARRPQGFIFLVIIPALLIIFSELRVIKDEFRKKSASKQAQLLLLFGTLTLTLGATYAYFSDTETSAGNQFVAASWGTHLVINEFMPNPDAVADADGEWFEIYNPTDDPFNLENWVIKDGDTDTHTVSGSLPIAAGDYLVLCRNDDSGTNGGVACDYEYGNDIELANDPDDEIILLNDSAEEVDRIAYDTSFPYADGISAELKDALMDNDTAGNWEAATDTYGDGDKGTPGAAN